MVEATKGAFYGRFVILTDPEPDETLIREAKKFLCESVRQTQKHFNAKAKNLKFAIAKNYEIIDDATGETVIVSKVQWTAQFE